MAARKKPRPPKRLFQRPPGLLIPKGSQVVRDMPGQIKMSEVIEDFVEPYRGEGDTIDSLRALFSLATFAWNCAILPADQHAAQITKLIDSAEVATLAPDRPIIRSLLEELIQRKLDHFADIPRAIISVHLVDQGKRYNIQVASTPDLSRMRPRPEG